MVAEEEPLGARAARSIGWIALEQWSIRILSMVVFIALARLVPKHDFGLVAMATVFTTVLQVFVSSGFSTALIQRKHVSDVDSSTAFWTSIGISLTLYGLLASLSPWLESVLHIHGLGQVLVVMGLMLPLTALSRVPAALLTREFQFKTLGIRQMIASGAAALAALGVAVAGGEIWALVTQVLVEASVGTAVLWRTTTWRPSLSYSTKSLRDLWSIGFGQMLTDLLDAVQAQLDKLIVGALFSTSDLGTYAVAQRLGVLIQSMLSSVIARVSLTTFSRVNGEPERVRHVFHQLTFAASFVSFPAFGMVGVLAPQLIPALFGPGWEGAVPIVQVLAIGWAFSSIALFDRGALVGTGHVATALWLAIVQNVISAVLIVAFAPFGVIGIAWSRLARLATWPIRLVVLHRAIGLDALRYVLQVMRVALAVVPAIAVIALLQATPWANSRLSLFTFVMPLATAGAVTSIALAWVFADASNRESVRNALNGVPRRPS